MNFEFMNELFNLVPKVKVGYVASNLKKNVFLIDDEDENGDNTVNLVNKFQMVLSKFLADQLNVDAVYDLVKDKLQLQRHQFEYLYYKFLNDLRACSIAQKVLLHLEQDNKLKTCLKENDYTYIAEFLIRECNNAVKFIK
jgi:Autographa californica nuclear polyhedrosis virus (AcMNPV), Ac75